jgi:hypothetical protein
MMRNPTSSSPPVITGPGDGYRRGHWPQTWCSHETFAATCAIFLILVAGAFEPTFAVGLASGLACVIFIRRTA